MNWDITTKIRSADEEKGTPSTAVVSVLDLSTKVTVTISITNLEDLDDSIMSAVDMAKSTIKSLKVGS